MEFSININEVLPGIVTVISNINGSLHAQEVKLSEVDDVRKLNNQNSVEVEQNIKRKWRDIKEKLILIIDSMGKASAKAQNLHTPITSGTKLQQYDQQLYVIKDSEANSGLGSIIGMLKVGKKRLFIMDERGAHNELDPLCVLDFYVHETKQRQGYGHILFQHMLDVEQVPPVHMAIDRPSPKFLAFLQKHYRLKDSITQANNFVIFQGFFNNRKIEKLKEASPSGRQNRSASNLMGYKRNSANKMETLKDIPLHDTYQPQRYRSLSSSARRCLQLDNFDGEPQGKSHYSRYQQSLFPQNNRKASRTWGGIVSAPCSADDREENDICKQLASHPENFDVKTKHGVMKNFWESDLSDTSPGRKHSQRKWNEMDSSWKVLGVPPRDYSSIQNHGCRNNRQELVSTRPW